MGRIYTVEFEAVAVSVAVDFFELDAAADKPIKVHAVYLSQSSDVGDAAEEILRYRIIRGHTTTGTGGTQGVTPRPVGMNTTAAGFAADTCNTAGASAGTAVNLHSDAFNIRTGLQLIFTPEMRVETSGTELLVVRLMAAPIDALTMSGTIYVEELS